MIGSTLGSASPVPPGVPLDAFVGWVQLHVKTIQIW
jgi:hypothetical protein